MKVALIGASGKAGSRVLKELADRGHEVTALVRNPDNVADLPGVSAVAVSGDGSDLADKIAGHDAVISSVRFVDLDPDVLLPAIKASGVKRYLVVGGAGSLMHPDGVIEVEQRVFPMSRNRIRSGAAICSTSSKPRKALTGRTFRRRECSFPANGPGRFVTARTTC